MSNSKIIKCSTGGIDNKVITRQELKPLPTNLDLAKKLEQMKFFNYPMTQFAELFYNPVEREEFYHSYFRESNNNIETLLRQPANGDVKINRFTSKKILDIYRKNNE